jgi:hypothetical protein
MKKAIHLAFICMCLLFINCQDILECIINRHPELPKKALAVAEVNQFYQETITAEIKNEPLDDSYNYFFSINGNLPRGLDYYVDLRTLVFEGVPLVAGTYTIKVGLSVSQSSNYSDDCESNFNDCDGLCKEFTSETYTIIVN